MTSWAERLAAASTTANNTKSSATSQRIVATSSEPSTIESFTEVQHVSESFSLPSVDKHNQLLVVDTNALIHRSNDLFSSVKSLLTVKDILAECRDQNLLEYLQRLPCELTICEPSHASLQMIKKVAIRTGDFGSLSIADLRLCALSLDCAKALNCFEESKIPLEDFKEETTFPEESLPGWGNEEDDDEEGWITQETLRLGITAGWTDGKPLTGNESAVTAGDTASNSPIMACASSDFAVQNVLLHVGVPVVNSSGLYIRTLNRWALRCHACGEVVLDTTRLFCPSCGSGNTLKRVTIHCNVETGEQVVHINPNHHISTRGTKYTLSKPKGGRRGTNQSVVLREDQLKDCGRENAHIKSHVLFSDMLTVGSGVESRHTNNTRRRMGDGQRVTSSYQRYNVNERRKQLAARRK